MTTPRIDPERVGEIVNRIREGDVFVTPTDTAYGLGASIGEPDSVRRVFEIKGRSPQKPVPVLLERNSLDDRFELSSVEEKAIEFFWPGGLTLVVGVKAPEDFPDGVTRERTMAVREPAHEPLLALLRKTGPITGTSANPSGGATPGSVDAVDPVVLEAVDFVISGPEVAGEGSTVAEWNAGEEKWIVHREGPVSFEDLKTKTVDTFEKDGSL